MIVEHSASVPAALSGPRAGLLRRLAAFLLDCLIVGLPFQVIAVVLYLGTNGAVHMSSAVLSFHDCNQLDAVPANLEPAAPQNANFVQLCVHSLFGLEHGRTLTVGVSERNRLDPKSVRSYSIAPDGQVRDGWDIEWLELWVYLALTIGLEARNNQSPGKRVMRIAAVSADGPFPHGLPWKRSVARNLIHWVFFLPLLIAAQWWVLPNGEYSKTGVLIAAVTLLVTLCWFLIIFRQISKGRQAIYDRICGTEVILIPPTSAKEADVAKTAFGTRVTG